MVWEWISSKNKLTKIQEKKGIHACSSSKKLQSQRILTQERVSWSLHPGLPSEQRTLVWAEGPCSSLPGKTDYWILLESHKVHQSAKALKSPGVKTSNFMLHTIYQMCLMYLTMTFPNLFIFQWVWALELWNTDRESSVTCPKSHSLLVPEMVLDFTSPAQTDLRGLGLRPLA